MSIVDLSPTAETLDGIAVFERGAWFAAVRIRRGDDEATEMTVFHDFAYDDAHQAVRAARVKAAAFDPNH